MGDEKQNLAATCGLYCGACTIFRAGKRGDEQLLAQIVSPLSERFGEALEGKDLVCDGCLSPDTVSVACRHCVLRDCAMGKGISRCAECSEFPCQQISDFNSDEFSHHHEVVGNIWRQRDIGIDAWITEQEKRWQCPQCSHAIDWYAGQCHNCGAALTSPFRPFENTGNALD